MKAGSPLAPPPSDLPLPLSRLHSSTLVAAEGTELLLLRREDYCAMLAMAEQALHIRSERQGDPPRDGGPVVEEQTHPS
jgi:hypothetical protein